MSKTLLGMTLATLILACADLAQAQQSRKVPWIGYLRCIFPFRCVDPHGHVPPEVARAWVPGDQMKRWNDGVVESWSWGNAVKSIIPVLQYSN
jgi:hypothetical protein